MERCIYKQQARFLTGHSTVYQLIDLYHQSFDKKNHTGVVFCDISKAFDRVWHRGLVFKLRLLGIQGNLLKWLNNYLSDRQQHVLIGQSRSRLNKVNTGVPHGSVLGPLLFLCYVNDIFENLVSIARLRLLTPVI